MDAPLPVKLVLGLQQAIPHPGPDRHRIRPCGEILQHGGIRLGIDQIEGTRLRVEIRLLPVTEGGPGLPLQMVTARLMGPEHLVIPRDNAADITQVAGPDVT